MPDLRSCCLAVLCLPPTILFAARGAGAQETTLTIQATGAAHPPAAGQAATAPPATAPPATASPATASPATAPVQVVPPPPLHPTVPAGTPSGLGGDRADAIAHDIVLHPPQQQVSKQDSARLRTITLKLGALLDRSVHGSEDSEVGRVIDVLVGDDGRPAALELDVGGFMGVGNRKIAVAWALFDMSKPGTEPLRVALTESQVKSAPAAAESGEVTVVTGVGGAGEQAATEAKPGSAIPPSPTRPAAVEAPAAAPPDLPALGLALSPVLVPLLAAPPPDAAPPDAEKSGDAAAEGVSGLPIHTDTRRDLPPPATTASPVPRQAASSAGRR